MTRTHPLAALLLLLLPLTACQPPAKALPSEKGPTTITITSQVLHLNVKRLGINLSGQSFYDSGQMLRNLTFRNPGFEAETWQSILHCKSITPTTCTDENQYAQWPTGFLDGAQYTLISGSAQGATGLIKSSLAAADNHGVTLTFADPPHNLTAGDYLLVRIPKPGGAEAGWWKDLHNGATLTTETHDLSPHTPGRQALRIDASAPTASAKVSSYFDSFNGRSFVQLHGRYTLTFRARLLTGAPTVTVSLERLDTTHGIHSFFHRDIPLTPTWHDYTFDLDAADIPAAVGTVGLNFNFAGTAALLDDVALTAAAAPNNPTAFRNEVVDTLRALHPGVLRYMDNGTNFGSSLDNLLAVPFARQRSGASTQGTLQEDISIGLDEFLHLCAAIGAEPWFSMPPGTSPEEARHLVEYLAGDPATPYGARRATLGQRQPWSQIFPTIHLELGNEQWNARAFAGSAINDPTAYGQRAGQIYTALRTSPAFHPERFDLILGSWATVPWWTGQELTSSTAYNSVAVAPYLFSEFNDATTLESVFGPMFAEPEMVDSRPAGYMAQQLAAATKAHATLAVYETNLGTMSGTVPQAALDRTVPSLGAGLAVANHMLLMLRDLGVTTQCLFALPEYVNDFLVSSQEGPATPKPHETMPLWGAVVDMGGPTNARRPQFLTEQLANAAILPTMLTTHVGGTPQTWSQPSSTNNKIELANAQLLQTFAFADGPRRSLILLNLSRDRTLPVQFTGPHSPHGQVEETLLTAPTITANNEQSIQVTPHKRTLPLFNPTHPYPLPPYSMTTLTWTQN